MTDWQVIESNWLMLLSNCRLLIYNVDEIARYLSDFSLQLALGTAFAFHLSHSKA